MFGLGKKNKKDPDQADNPETAAENTDAEGQDGGKGKKTPGKKKNLIKLIFIITIVLIAVGASGFLVYKLYLTPKDPEVLKTIYNKVELKHVNLPEEIVKFTFDNLPDLYFSMVTFNDEINLFEKEIARIDDIAIKYPDQKKIADKEKKTWEKGMGALQKVFIKIEKPVTQTYVLFRVNKDQGLLKVEEIKKDLTSSGQAANTTAQEMTLKLKSNEIIPEGMIKGTIYKLKKKFL
jgi:hypothetical protein